MKFWSKKWAKKIFKILNIKNYIFQTQIDIWIIYYPNQLKGNQLKGGLI